MSRAWFALPWPWLASLFAWLFVSHAYAVAPRLYSQPTYQSPVRADPDDLIFLAGDGLSKDDIIVYQSDLSMNRSIKHPGALPTQSTAEIGLATIVSSAGAPYQLTVRLPDVFVSRRVYHIWVRNAAHQWSQGIRINDARPIWFSPAEVFSTVTAPGLESRYLKVIGRNLLPVDGMKLAVRLTGAVTYELPQPDSKIRHQDVAAYAAMRRLPSLLAPGEYRVEVRTEGADWMPVQGQLLHVIADPKSPPEFLISDPRFGGCRADDGRDDTDCLVKALSAAQVAGGGIVILGKGTWEVTPGVAVAPPNVHVRGEGIQVTKVERRDLPANPPDLALLTLLGYNTVSDISFSDQHVFQPQDSAHPILQLGLRFSTDQGDQARSSTVSHVVITRNEFDKTYGAVVDGGTSLSNIFITYNQFGDYHLALDLGGNRFNVNTRFRIDDAVIAYNNFMPGSYMDVAKAQGVMASQMGAGSRVDFSSNIADGSDRTYLYSAADSPGWRAAFFWHMNNSQEMLLISENNVSCSGDKAGDGEAIALDNNANTFALPGTRAVVRSTLNSVTVAGPLTATQNDRAIDVNNYYAEHWIRIDDGPGIGQSRKIVSYRIEPGNSETTFTVAPSWDVPPQPRASTLSVTRQFWETFVVANHIDQRTPECRKTNRTRPKGGVITVWAQSTDSVIDGNQQFDTDGILFQQAYVARDPSCPTCDASDSMPAFLEIRNNLIDGEYDWGSACSLSGIMGSYGASPTPDSPPPPLSFAVSISHNRIHHADGLYGGAINIGATWYEGPAGYAKALVAGVAIDHNEITQISGGAPLIACHYDQKSRVGIHLRGHAHQDSTVLYMNICKDVSKPLFNEAAHTLRICDRSPTASCECGSAN